MNIPAPTTDGMPVLASSDVAVAAAASGPDIAALTSALSAKGVDGDTANRALYAYRRSMGMTTQPVLASAY